MPRTVPTARPAALTAEQAATVLGIDRRTLYRGVTVDDCPIPFVRIGRAIRFPVAGVAAFLGIHPDEVWAASEAQ